MFVYNVERVVCVRVTAGGGEARGSAQPPRCASRGARHRHSPADVSAAPVAPRPRRRPHARFTRACRAPAPPATPVPRPSRRTTRLSRAPCLPADDTAHPAATTPLCSPPLARTSESRSGMSIAPLGQISGIEMTGQSFFKSLRVPLKASI